MSRVAAVARGRRLSPAAGFAVSVAVTVWGSAALAQTPAPKVYVQPSPVFTAPAPSVKINPIVTPVPAVSVTPAPIISPAPMVTKVPGITTTLSPAIVKDAGILTVPGSAKPATTVQPTTAGSGQVKDGAVSATTVLVKGQDSKGATSDGASKDKEKQGGTQSSSSDDAPGNPDPRDAWAKWKDCISRAVRSCGPPPDRLGGGDDISDVRKPVQPKPPGPELPRPDPPQPGPFYDPPRLAWLAPAQTLYLPKPTFCEVVELDPRRRLLVEQPRSGERSRP